MATLRYTQAGPEQLCLIPYEEPQSEPETRTVAVMVPAKTTSDPLKDDKALAGLRTKLEGHAANKDLNSIIGMAGKECLVFNNRHFINTKLPFCFTVEFCDYRNPQQYEAIKNTGLYLNDAPGERYHRETDKNVYEINLNFIHVSDNLCAYVIPVNVYAEKQEHNYFHNIYGISEIKIGKTAEVKRLYNNSIFLQEEKELRALIDKNRPYVRQWLDEPQPYKNLKTYLMAPWLETLDKAGYDFAADMLQFDDPYPKQIELFNRLTGPGTKPKQIFKTQKCVYECLKHERDLAKWDVYRRMCKAGKLNQDTVRQVYEGGFDDRLLEKANSILSKEYNGRKVFTWESLVRYLGRLDMFEAIPNYEAMQLLADYLSMCSQLDMEPRIDGDSLKREHDIAARIIRNRYNEKVAEDMRKRKESFDAAIAEGNSRLARLNYKEKIYFIKLIDNYDDLLDEAKQQVNCVASYADAIIKGTSIILVMRETAHPDKSLVTIELSPDCKTIRQKLMAHNQPIRNKSISEFIERWFRQLSR